MEIRSQNNIPGYERLERHVSHPRFGYKGQVKFDTAQSTYECLSDISQLQRKKRKEKWPTIYA